MNLVPRFLSHRYHRGGDNSIYQNIYDIARIYNIGGNTIVTSFFVFYISFFVIYL